MSKFLVSVILILFSVSAVSLAADSGGLKTLKVNGDFRFRFTNSEAAGVNDSMTINRARIKLSGNVTEDLSLLIQPDFAGLSNGGAVAFADAYADLKICGYKVRAGQFLLPFAYDSGIYNTIIYPSHYNVIVPDRDFGLGVCGKADLAAYFVSLTNGNCSGADNNKSKDLAARIIADTMAGEVGVSAYLGKTGATSKDQKAAGIYLKSSVSDAVVVAEYVIGTPWTGGSRLNNAYLQVSKKMDTIEPLVQYQVYDPDTSVANNIVNTLTLGVNNYLADNGSRLMLNYNIVGEEAAQISNNTLVVQLNVKI